MRKGSSSQLSPKRMATANHTKGSITVGMDLGDKSSCYCALDRDGGVVREGSVGTTKKAVTQVFGSMRQCRVALEVGTHSPWISRLLSRLGHEVIVANPRQVKLAKHI